VSTITDRLRGLRRSAGRWRAFAPVAAVAWCAVAVLEALITLVVLGVFSLAGSIERAPALEPGSVHAGAVERPGPFIQPAASALALSGGLDATPTPTPKPSLIWPALGRISQPMWAKHPSGIDIAVDSGTPIRAVRDGRVVSAGGDPCCSYGLFVVVEHSDGWTSLYGHLSLIAVEEGEEVRQSQLIGLSGQSGYTSGAHLHFELRESGTPVDPLRYLAPP